jgi:hypothetical protein
MHWDEKAAVHACTRRLAISMRDCLGRSPVS